MTTLKKYQEEGLEEIKRFKGRCLLAWDMGLGKTFTALSYAVQNKLFPLVVVCPKSLKLHWQKECWQHFKLKAEILNTNNTKALSSEVVIVNYDILQSWVPELIAIDPKCIVGDEIHRIKNIRAKQSKAFRRLCRQPDSILALSGTPMENNPIELFSILNILRPDKFPSLFAFGTKYTNARFDFGHWMFPGAKNLKHLNQVLRTTCMSRIAEEEVLEQLPPIRKFVVPLEIDNRKEYEAAEKDLIGWLKTKDLAKAEKAQRAECWTRFYYLKHLAAQLKLSNVKGWLDSFLVESDGKILVGTTHRDIIGNLHETYKGLSVVIDGSRTAVQRQIAEDCFRQKKGTRILFGQLKAAGVGLNFPEAHDVALVELPWTSAACDQFIARCRRITSVGSVRAYFLIAEDTIEADICKIIERKSKHLSVVLDGKTNKQRDLNIFQELQLAMERRKNGQPE